MKYHFDSLADMAELFAENARKIRARVPNASPQSKRIMQSEAHAWEQAATIAKDAVFAPQLPAGAVVTALSLVGTDQPMHPANAAPWVSYTDDLGATRFWAFSTDPVPHWAKDVRPEMRHHADPA